MRVNVGEQYYEVQVFAIVYWIPTCLPQPAMFPTLGLKCLCLPNQHYIASSSLHSLEDYLCHSQHLLFLKLLRD